MKEFGSDLHYMFFNKASELPYIANYYADGRHALIELINFKKWNRIWMPEYFCYEVVDAIAKTGIKILFYQDSPLLDDEYAIRKIKFDENDVVLRMNYFGIRALRDNSDIPVDVIEDHSHDLISHWALNSNADYCIASLRKTLPLPEGGILWSPKNSKLPTKLESTIENELIVYKKLSAMLLKREYLLNDKGDKQMFREIFIESEYCLDNLNVSGISPVVTKILNQIDLEKINQNKKQNWEYLNSILKNSVNILQIEKGSIGTPFSLIMLFESEQRRDTVKTNLIMNSVYPAILWSIPSECNQEIKDFGDRMISISCDSRYNNLDIEHLVNKILRII